MSEILSEADLYEIGAMLNIDGRPSVAGIKANIKQLQIIAGDVNEEIEHLEDELRHAQRALEVMTGEKRLAFKAGLEKGLKMAPR